MYQLIGLQTPVPAVDPELPPVPCGHSLKAPGSKPAKLSQTLDSERVLKLGSFQLQLPES